MNTKIISQNNSQQISPPSTVSESNLSKSNNSKVIPIFFQKTKKKARKAKNLSVCFLCQIEDCQKLFKTEKELLSHKNTHIKTFSCLFNNCGKVFMTETNYEKHLKRHYPTKKKFACTYPGCNKKYTAPHNLAIHLRHHTGNRPYFCEICGKNFFYQGAKKYHIKAKHKIIKKSDTVCQHIGCEYKSKTNKLKLMHHGILEPECVNEKKNLLNLLIEFHKGVNELLSIGNNNIDIDDNYDKDKLKFVYSYLNSSINEEIMNIRNQSKILYHVCLDKDQYQGFVDNN